ncbi:MAG: hypothetical protein ACRDHE_12870 [Ktedonobacterales bacterium]
MEQRVATRAPAVTLLRPLRTDAMRRVLYTQAESGQSASFYPAGLPAALQSFNVSLASARSVDVENLLRQLAALDPIGALFPVLREIERVPTVCTSGQYTVYEQPAPA